MDLLEFQKTWGDYESLRVIQSRDVQKDIQKGYVVALYGKKNAPYRMARVGRIYESPFGEIVFASRFLKAHPELKNVVVVREKTDPREFVYSFHDKSEYSKKQSSSATISVLRKGGAASHSKDVNAPNSRRQCLRGSSMVLGEKLPTFGTLEPGPRYAAQRQAFVAGEGKPHLSGVLNAHVNQQYDIPVNKIAAVSERQEEAENLYRTTDPRDYNQNAKDIYAIENMDTLPASPGYRDDSALDHAEPWRRNNVYQDSYASNKEDNPRGGNFNRDTQLATQADPFYANDNCSKGVYAENDSRGQKLDPYDTDKASTRNYERMKQQYDKAQGKDLYRLGMENIALPDDCPPPFDFGSRDFLNLSSSEQVEVLKQAVIMREAALCRYINKLQCLKDIFDK